MTADIWAHVVVDYITSIKDRLQQHYLSIHPLSSCFYAVCYAVWDCEWSLLNKRDDDEYDLQCYQDVITTSSLSSYLKYGPEDLNLGAIVGK